jgi:hypothetical protein
MEGRHPTNIEFVRIVKHITRVQMVAGIFNRLFF